MRCALALIAALALSAALPALASATRVHLGDSVYRFFAKATNGYELRLSTYQNNLYHRITLTAESPSGAIARYNVEGSPHGGRVDATFPGVGRIDVKLHRRKVRRLPPPEGCELPKAEIVSGVFVGKIRFEGERDFTSIDADQARGYIERSHRQECQRPTRSGASLRWPTGLPTHFTVLEIQNGPVKVYAEGVYMTGTAGFIAQAREERDGMGILRRAPEALNAGDLLTSEDLTHATIAPPAPFLGTATYLGTPQQTGCPLPCPPPVGEFLTGTLRVPLPGLGVVPLAGAGVNASLTESTRAY
ncbi:MAG TPA: hypothetical protein VFJ57_12110 [Solirubrobacterales bacterium]|nr:hypothetical protein [Solirubrobacterales bacterium]